MRHPPFVAVPPRMISDTCSETGARRLAAVIRDAWARCGHDVPVEVFQIAGTKVDKPQWAVRMPTLVNGLPVAAP